MLIFHRAQLTCRLLARKVSKSDSCLWRVPARWSCLLGTAQKYWEKSISFLISLSPSIFHNVCWATYLLLRRLPPKHCERGAATKISLALVIIWPCRHFLAFSGHFWQICRSAKPILGIMPSVGIVLISWGHIWKQWQVRDDILALLIALPLSCFNEFFLLENKNKTVFLREG